MKIGIEISEDIFKESKKINEKLLEVLLIEEKFDILLCNYFELEEALLDISLKKSIFNYEENQENVDRAYTFLKTAKNLSIDAPADFSENIDNYLYTQYSNKSEC